MRRRAHGFRQALLLIRRLDSPKLGARVGAAGAYMMGIDTPMPSTREMRQAYYAADARMNVTANATAITT